jgi:formyltetrahydrofolate deformylase
MDLKPIANHSIFRFMFLSLRTTKNQEKSNKSNYLKHEINFIVLARYMQIITPNLISYENKIINIHHSFLAFP